MNDMASRYTTANIARNSSKKCEADLWTRTAAVVGDLHPALQGWRVRMVAVEGGLRLWSGSRGELQGLIEDSEMDTITALDSFESDQTDTLDPLPGHHLVVMESMDGKHRVVVNVFSRALFNDAEPHPENKLSLADANREVARESYTILPSGTAIVCELIMLNGHKEHGIANVVDGRNFDFEEGKKAARGRALDGVFKILAHRKHETVKE